MCVCVVCRVRECAYDFALLALSVSTVNGQPAGRVAAAWPWAGRARLCSAQRRSSSSGRRKMRGNRGKRGEAITGKYRPYSRTVVENVGWRPRCNPSADVVHLLPTSLKKVQLLFQVTSQRPDTDPRAKRDSCATLFFSFSLQEM